MHALVMPNGAVARRRVAYGWIQRPGKREDIGNAFTNGLLEEFKEFGGIGGHAFGRRSLGAGMRSS